MPKMMSPNTTIWWVPLAGIVAPSAVKATEINAGTNISAAIVTGFTLGATASDKDSSRTIADEGDSDTPTFDNFDGKLTFFRDEIGSGTQQAPQNSTVFTTALNLFKAGRVEGYLVSRQGKKQSAACAVGDVVSTYHFISDYALEKEGQGGGPMQVEVTFLPQGDCFLNIPAA